jgi:hypothetical protein
VGIVRTVEWKLTCSPAEADARFRQAFAHLNLNPEGPPGSIHGAAKRAIMKNRWAAEVTVDLAPAEGGTAAICRVDMAGTKHFEVLGDIAEAVGDDVYDDRGVADAVQRLGKAGRIFGRKEVRHVRNLLRSTERVTELGQGQYGNKQGLVVLTNERLFFFEKSLGSETVEEFGIGSISSLSVSKKLTGETLQVHASGNAAEIKSMMHGQADAVARAFRNLKQVGSTGHGSVVSSGANDPIEQLERLAALRDKGVLSSEEFEAKKAELLNRM